MKWYYISHPYTGNEEENRKKAADVQRHLHEMYADIMCINPLAMFAPLAALSYEKIMTYCLEVMQPADAVIMCSGYEKSRGCMREYEAAKQGGKTILFYEGGDAPLVDIEEHEKGDKVQEIFREGTWNDLYCRRWIPVTKEQMISCIGAFVAKMDADQGRGERA